MAAKTPGRMIEARRVNPNLLWEAVLNVTRLYTPSPEAVTYPYW